NNVARVRIADDEISGSFIKPFLWPQPAPGGQATGKTGPSPSASSGPAPNTPAPNAQRPTPNAPRSYTRFLTIFPQSVGDSTLMPLLEQDGVEVNVARQLSPWLTALLSNGLPLLLLLLFFAWMGRRAAQSQAGIFGFGRTRARQITGDQPKVTFNDVAGAEEA